MIRCSPTHSSSHADSCWQQAALQGSGSLHRYDLSHQTQGAKEDLSNGPSKHALWTLGPRRVMQWTSSTEIHLPLIQLKSDAFPLEEWPPTRSMTSSSLLSVVFQVENGHVVHHEDLWVQCLLTWIWYGTFIFAVGGMRNGQHNLDSLLNCIQVE